MLRGRVRMLGARRRVIGVVAGMNGARREVNRMTRAVNALVADSPSFSDCRRDREGRGGLLAGRERFIERWIGARGQRRRSEVRGRKSKVSGRRRPCHVLIRRRTGRGRGKVAIVSGGRIKLCRSSGVCSAGDARTGDARTGDARAGGAEAEASRGEDRSEISRRGARAAGSVFGAVQFRGGAAGGEV
jgi:hypothetical protein